MEPASQILCVDIGGTRIKATVLPREAGPSHVRPPRVCAIPTLGWLNDSLPRLLATENVRTILRRAEIKPEYDAIHVAVPGPVTEGRWFERHDLWAQGVPRNLREEFEKHTKPLPVWLIKDADAWAGGMVRYAQLFDMPLEYPSLALTFGTGVGISAARSADVVVSLEVGASPPGTWHRLAAAAGPSIHTSSQVHRILGREFFAWVAGAKTHWSAERIREEFTRRLVAFVLDARENLREGLGGEFKSLVIGGGNAEYVVARDLERETGHRVHVLARPAISVSPDVIALLGLSHGRDRVAVTRGPW